jgi:hypothetical protein
MPNIDINVKRFDAIAGFYLEESASRRGGWVVLRR